MFTVRRPLTTLVRTAFALLLGLGGPSTAVSAQGGSTRPAPVPAARRFVAIGCISREGTAAAPRYVITDTRGDTPAVYRLEGDRTTIERHVGHRVEVAGPLEPAATAGPAARLTLRVTSLVWLATTCSP